MISMAPRRTKEATSWRRRRREHSKSAAIKAENAQGARSGAPPPGRRHGVS